MSNDDSDNTLDNWANKMFRKLYKILLPHHDLKEIENFLKKQFITITIIEVDDTQENEDIDADLKSLVNLHYFDRKFWKNENNAKSVSIVSAPFLKQTQGDGSFNNVVLCHGNTRLVWFSDYFESTPKEKPIDNKRLGIYHRYLTLLSLQTEILLGIIKEFSEEKLINSRKRHIAKRALILLKMLCSSGRTFLSWNTIEHVERHSCRINNVHKITYPAGDEFCIIKTPLRNKRPNYW
ncbi:hypothetical protein [Methylovulum sp.]|uniref:hypothetical protein n=1 Tax=Methylovulum sp. TaxID=1916980 RepID=UPI0026098885|nr:hypothetical protein [Methylovulum sp.]